MHPNIGAPKYTKQTLTDKKGETDNNAIIAGNINAPFTWMDRLFRQKINKETVPLNNTSGQLDLIDIYRTFYLKKKQNAQSFEGRLNVLWDGSHTRPKPSLNKFRE